LTAYARALSSFVAAGGRPEIKTPILALDLASFLKAAAQGVQLRGINPHLMGGLARAYTRLGLNDAE